MERVSDGSIIVRFDKTPHPRKKTDVICPHFVELKWAYGCPFDCSWCYLKGTFRFRPEGIKPVVKNLEKVRRHVEVFLDEVAEPEVLNTGEIADSLMMESQRRSFAKLIIPLFEKQNRHRVLFVTKAINVRNLVGIESPRQTIVSFSLNALPVAKVWEKKAPHVPERIRAAARLQKEGYEIRIRVDPMVPVDNWRRHYRRLIDKIMTNLVPERITLGSLRGLQSTINGTKDTSWVHYLTERSNWGRKIGFESRLQMYSEAMDYLRKEYGYSRVALCKETKAILEILGMDYRKIACNCTW